MGASAHLQPNRLSRSESGRRSHGLNRGARQPREQSRSGSLPAIPLLQRRPQRRLHTTWGKQGVPEVSPEPRPHAWHRPPRILGGWRHHWFYRPGKLAVEGDISNALLSASGNREEGSSPAMSTQKQPGARAVHRQLGALPATAVWRPPYGNDSRVGAPYGRGKPRPRSTSPASASRQRNTTLSLSTRLAGRQV